MTIFDVLRYQISDPPTESQLRALPESVYNKWCRSSSWKGFPRDDMTVVAEYYNFFQHHLRDTDSVSYKEDIILLKALIRDYDEPI